MVFCFYRNWLERVFFKMSVIELSRVEKKKSIEVAQINSRDDSLRSELESIGFIPGTKMELIEIAPFSGPISVKIRGTKIALRRQEANTIYVHSE